MSLTLKILGKVRYLTLLPLIMLIGLITLPLTLLFRWNGFWILSIAHYEGCSLSKARALLKEGAKYQICYNSVVSTNSNNKSTEGNSSSAIFSDSRDDSFASPAGSHETYQTSPTYSYLNYNINHTDYNNNHNP
jgi:hypothetical protein